MHLLDEVAEHFFADIEVSDNAITKRPYRLDVAGRAPDHLLGFGTNSKGAAIIDVDRHDRRLVEHDAFATDVDKRVRRAQIHGHVPAHYASYRTKEARHEFG